MKWNGSTGMRAGLALFAVAVLGMTPGAFAQGKGGKVNGGCRGGTEVTAPFGVTATFRGPVDKIQSDGMGKVPYAARITCAGELEIANWDETGRQIFLSFTDPVDPDYITWEVTTSPFQFVTNVLPDEGDPVDSDGTLVGGLLGIPAGQSRRSRLKVNLLETSGGLVLRFKPDQFSDTDPVRVTRDSQETSWVIETLPNDEMGAHDVAKLVTSDYCPSCKGKPRGHEEGNFHMPFQLVVTLP